MGHMIAYADGAQPLEGYFAPPRDRATADLSVGAQAPGVLIVHTFLGLNEGIKHRADRLAELGYATFALDVFGPGVHPALPVEALAAIKPFRKDRQQFRQRLQAGLKVLQSQLECDASRIAAIGYCFGGCGILELARSGAPLRGVVSFHGELDSPLPAQPGALQAKILVLHGDADPVVPFEQITTFRDEMRAAGANWEIGIYSNAKHSFTGEGAMGNTTPEAGLEPQAEARSWQAMLNFFEEVLRS